MHKHEGQFVIDAQRNDAFAALSGDFNPLHVDPVYSRRLQFGHTVIHGVHHMLSAWDKALGALDVEALGGVQAISGNFQNPAQIDQVISYVAELDVQSRQLLLSAHSEGRLVLSLKVTYLAAGDHDAGPEIKAGFPKREQALEQDYPPAEAEGVLGLFADAATVEQLLPNLAAQLPAYRLAQILACTRVVGMRTPGLHSIFSRINLVFSPASGEASAELSYFQQRADDRVQLLKVGVASAGMEGALDTFFRPKPVAQPGFAQLREQVPAQAFAGQQALVVGGSRGVGETTAKLLAAGGAQVTITYHRGEAEARRVAQDIQANGGACEVRSIDVTGLADWQGSVPTHVYYFASPHIDANRSAQWDNPLFERFCAFYVQGFSQLATQFLQQMSAQQSITFYYPSSVYIDTPERGFAEYAVAKGAGEALCQQLAARYRNARFVYPRLPRMLTDQTASIIPIKSEPVLDVMLRELLTLSE